MSRPGAWARVASNFYKYIRGDFSKKSYIGEDSVGNKYYEIKSSRQNVGRGYEPKDSSTPKPTLEWEAWLKNTRRFPPSEDEIALNRTRAQAQLAQDTVTEKRAPMVSSAGPGAGDGPKTFPKYKDFEEAPGARRE